MSEAFRIQKLDPDLKWEDVEVKVVVSFFGTMRSQYPRSRRNLKIELLVWSLFPEHN